MPESYYFNKIYHVNPIYRNRLSQLLYKFIHHFDSNTLTKLYTLISTGKPDKDIVEFIIDKSKGSYKFDSKKRATKAAEKIKLVYDNIPEKYTITNINKYLDIGCNNGTITIEFGTLLGLDDNKIYGIDLDKFYQQQIKNVPGFIFKTFDGYNIPYDTEEFDIITSLMVLHHVEYQKIWISEVRRVLKKNGIIILKEHNAYSNELELLIKSQHMLYDTIDNNISYDQFEKEYRQYLLSKKQLVKLFKEFGFEKIKLDNKKIIEEYYSYNPTKNYYICFVKRDLSF